MDPRITRLKSTTFYGKRFTRNQISTIQDTVRMFPALSRRELANTICEQLSWFTPTGKNKIQACLRTLERLEALDIVSLPALDESQKRGPQKKITWTRQSDEQPPICDELAHLEPITLQVVTDKALTNQWNELVDRHHYLGYKRPIGPHLRYFILDGQARPLGCLLFSYATQSLPCRDEWIGWQDTRHKKNLQLVVNNNRFLLLPWVKVKCLASKALSIAARQLREDWHQHHGYRPVLLETFVDQTKFEATCYRAANWQRLGQTQARSDKTPKAVYVYPLTKDARSILINGYTGSAKARRKPPIRRPKPLTPTDPFVQIWQNIIGTLVSVANDYDQQWQKRKRVLNTLLIMLFVFRLVLSKNKQGYTTTIMELWDQCRAMGIELPQPEPVAASAFCNARAKLDENSFKILHAEILQSHNRSRSESRWKGHRLFAIDGSKINLPRQAINYGYRSSSDNAHYPQGLLSCLYQLKEKIPTDFDLVAHGDERKVALTHLTSLAEQDVVVYDRGYFSYAVLWEHVVRGIHPVFRIQQKASVATDEFIASDDIDRIVMISLPRKAKTGLFEKYPQTEFPPIPLRVVKYTVAGTHYVLGTTLVDSQAYTIDELSDVYHARWGVEELYKTSKQLMGIEEFHGQTERGIKQELFAHFVLITLTRIFSNHTEQDLNSTPDTDDTPTVKANFKNALITVARNIEVLLLQQAELMSATVNRIVRSIFSCRQKIRPNRSYDRRSRKPIGKWKPPKLAKTPHKAQPATA